MNVRKPQDAGVPEGFFLPDLCNPLAVVYLLIVSEGLVVTLTLMESGLAHFSWQRFGLVSLFVQWVALVSVALLCRLRRPLSQWPLLHSVGAAMLLVQLVNLVVGVLADYFAAGGFFLPDWYWLGRNALVSALITALALRYFYVQSQWRLQSQAELRSRLSALQANIRPHFFFNTLNTVAALIPIDPDKAETILLDLAQLFRVVLKAEHQPASLAAEIELGRRYLGIEQIRLGDRMQVHWHLPEQLPDLQVPALLLQPLLENAVYHGIQPLPQGGDIQVSLERRGRYWILSVSNARQAGAGGKGNGVAQVNIRARLGALFGETARLDVTEQPDRYQAQLMLPDSTGGERT
ncbi:sensor histidine kinase [Parathalassolituus penaei]|uniref:Histidine kinase n=1 Tax=Parathalassolituus penaei TaxID=2997323 RepID=A0A9X3ECS7_9GAMM|nr:histidine kinase [Parathalassolituus penaei]MCY0965223.1 histidine kinase [Parathalassolituus penaei]